MNNKLLQGKITLVSCFDSNWISYLIAPLINNGARVTLITDTPLASFSDQIDPEHLKVLEHVALNTYDLNQVDKTCTDILSIYPNVDILVNGPTPPLYKDYVDTTSGDLSNIFQKHLGLLVTIIREAGKSMLSQRSGKVINIVSGLARRGLPGTAAYSASQAALLGLTRSLALEWAPYHINVNAIGIGWLSEGKSDAVDFSSITKFIPVRSLGHPNDIQGLLLYLLSPFSSYMTGTCINVDGGLISHA